MFEEEYNPNISEQEQRILHGWDMEDAEFEGELAPSFKAFHGRDAVAGVDYNPGDLCQDDYEYFTGTGRYSNTAPVDGYTDTSDWRYPDDELPLSCEDCGECGWGILDCTKNRR